MNKIVLEISEEIKKNNGKAYLVGGCVRDEVLEALNEDIDIEIKDIDIEIHNISEEQLINILSKYGNINKIGAKFGIYKIKGYDIDFSLPRTEHKTGSGHTSFNAEVNPFLGIEKACKRRDFRINSLLKDISENKIIDLFGGIEDIQNRIIKHVDKDTFVEDSLRVLRACQFSARFIFEIHKDTINLCKEIDLSDISYERVFKELEKAIEKGKKPSLFFSNLKEMNKLKPFFNELGDLSEEKFTLLMRQIDTIKNRNVENVLLLIGLSLGSKEYSSFVKRFSNHKHFNFYMINKIEAITAFLNSNKTDIDYRRLCYNTMNYKEIIFNLKEFFFNEDFEEKYNVFLEQVKVPIVTSKDLFRLNIPPVKFGINLKKAMDFQILGYTDKEDIIKKLI